MDQVITYQAPIAFEALDEPDELLEWLKLVVDAHSKSRSSCAFAARLAVGCGALGYGPKDFGIAKRAFKNLAPE